MQVRSMAGGSAEDRRRGRHDVVSVLWWGTTSAGQTVKAASAVARPRLVGQPPQCVRFARWTSFRTTLSDLTKI